MLVGVVVGPSGLGALVAADPWLGVVTIGDPAAIAPIAELGVVLLLFMIGLELSLRAAVADAPAGVRPGRAAGRRLRRGADRRARCCWAPPPIAAAVVGLALAMSSTAIVLQVLAEEKRLGTPLGRASFAVLLFQDLAVVPVLFVVAALDPAAGARSLAGFGQAVAQALLAVAAIVGARPAGAAPAVPQRRPHQAARNCSSPPACWWCIGTALATAAAGLSMALGALIGGLLLAGTEYRRQVEVTIEPFKGLLVGRVPDFGRHEPRSAHAARRIPRVDARRGARPGGAEGAGHQRHWRAASGCPGSAACRPGCCWGRAASSAS